MSTTAIESEVSGHTHAGRVDEAQAMAFLALEQRVLRAIELLRTERAQRLAVEQRAHAAEAHLVELEMRLDAQASRLAEQGAHSDGQGARLAEHAQHIQQLEGELSLLNAERQQVKDRVERLLHQLDEVTD